MARRLVRVVATSTEAREILSLPARGRACASGGLVCWTEALRDKAQAFFVRCVVWRSERRWKANRSKFLPLRGGKRGKVGRQGKGVEKERIMCLNRACRWSSGFDVTPFLLWPQGAAWRCW